MGRHSSGEPDEPRVVIHNVINQAVPNPDVYPGLGCGMHLLHLILTFLTGGLWIFVWVIHAIVVRSRWDKEQRARIAQENRESKSEQ